MPSSPLDKDIIVDELNRVIGIANDLIKRVVGYDGELIAPATPAVEETPVTALVAPYVPEVPTEPAAPVVEAEPVADSGVQTTSDLV